MADAEMADVRADTVHQQIVGRLTALPRMLAIVAESRGASSAGVSAVLGDMQTAVIAADTVFQQEVGRLSATLKLLALVATAG